MADLNTPMRSSSNRNAAWMWITGGLVVLAILYFALQPRSSATTDTMATSANMDAPAATPSGQDVTPAGPGMTPGAPADRDVMPVTPGGADMPAAPR